MKAKKLLKNQAGFTLIEIIAVLTIMGILAAVAMKKIIHIDNVARVMAVKAAVSELNSRESLRWAQLKMSPTSFGTDAALENEIVTGTTGSGWNTDVGSDYAWNAGDPTAVGGDLSFQSGVMISLTRTPATLKSPAIWKW